MFTCKTPLILVAVFSVLFLGCGEYQIPDGYKLVKISTPTNVGTTIDSADASSWTASWQAKLNGSSFIGTNPIIAFDIPHADINGVLNYPTARGYIALDQTSGSNDYHMVIVGVDSTGKDDTSILYDLTAPCPSVCDTTSFLYHSGRK